MNMLKRISSFLLGSSGILIAIIYWGISTGSFTSKQLQALLISTLVGVTLSCITTYLSLPRKSAYKRPESSSPVSQKSLEVPLEV